MTDNDNLELKKRSRRRLVGAAALALLAAIVLPMVMEQEPEAPAQDIQITIPDRDADSLLSRPIAGRSDRPEPQLAPAPEEQAPDDPVEIAATPAPAPAQPAPGAGAAAAGTSPPPEPAPSARAAEAAAPPAARSDDGARAIALLEGRTPPVGADEAFVVQVGAFGEAGKANGLGAELKKRGFSAYTEKAGNVTRVRVGPYPSRDEAEKVAAQLRASGHKGVVVQR